MKTIIFIIITISIAMGLMAYTFAEPLICPEGSYDAGMIDKNGEPICKLTPTGCPYGDAIPMDVCEKYAPEKQEVQEEASVYVPVIDTTEIVGKNY